MAEEPAMERWRRRDGLAHLGLRAGARAGASNAAVTLGHPAAPVLLLLRGRPGDAAFREPVEHALGMALPLLANTSTRAGPWTLLWLGPEEWLLVLPESAAELARSVAAALGEGEAGAVVDLTGGRELLAVGGARAADVLAKGTGIDLHPRAFAQGRCAQTRLAHADVLLHRPDESATFHVLVARSFADYVWRWLEDAALEYGFSTNW